MKAAVLTAEWQPREGYSIAEDDAMRRLARDGSQVWRFPRGEVRDHPDPVLRRASDVIVRVGACGICGSDLHMFHPDDDGYMTLAFRTALPVVPGHEFAGEVLETGPDVRFLRPGNLVAVENTLYCGTCTTCRRGLFNQCLYGADVGLNVDGGLAEFVVVPERACWSLNGLSSRYPPAAVLEIGALIEPTAVVYEAIFGQGRGIRPGSHALVVGCGPIGLASIALLRASGVALLFAVDPASDRRDLATVVGADAAWRSDVEEVTERIRELTRGEGVALVIEASGAGDLAFRVLEPVLAPGARVVAVGLRSGHVTVDVTAFQLQGACLCGSVSHAGGAFGAVVNLQASGRIDLRRLITTRYDLDDAIAAVESLAVPRGGKVLIKP